MRICGAEDSSADAQQTSTQTLHQHSTRAKEQSMVEALLSLSVTYRQLILPLVHAVEARAGEDAALHKKLRQIESQFEQLGQPGALGG